MVNGAQTSHGTVPAIEFVKETGEKFNSHNLKVTGSNPVPATKSKTPQSPDCGVLVLASSRAGSRCLFWGPIGDPFAVPINFFADMWRELDQLP
jgi:hypothetical protein